MFILGDIHGNFTYLRYLINTIGKKGPIIQVGDFRCVGINETHDLRF